MQSSETFPPISNAWFLTGSTASGKTTIGIELARRLDAEIIALDSMTVYRGMDIGTAKSTLEQREQVPHHLLDVVEPTVDFSLAEYISLAHQAVAEIRGRGKAALFVGGTPLYLKSLLRGLYQGPPPDWEFRKAVEEELQVVGIGALRQRLEMVDPIAAAKLHPHDQRRMIRALEVYKLTGQPLSHLQTQFETAYPETHNRVATLLWPRGQLHERIDARVDQMFAAGLVDEVHGLVNQHGALGRTASQAVGYREVLEHLRGEHKLDVTIEHVKNATHQFARRQETWFRGLAECRRFEQGGAERQAIEVAEDILRHLQD